MDRGDVDPMSLAALIRAVTPDGVPPAKFVARELTAATGEDVSYRQGRRYSRGAIAWRYVEPLFDILERFAQRRLDKADSDLKAIRYERMVGRAKASRMEADRRMAREAAERARPEQPLLNLGRGR